MKIKLTANTNTSLSPLLSKIDINYGFSYYSNPEEEKEVKIDSFSIRLLSKLDKFLSIIDKNLKQKNDAIINYVADSVNYINNNSTEESIKNLKVHVNVSSVLNKIIKKVLSDEIEQDRFTFQNMDEHYSCIAIKEKLVIIGAEQMKTVFANVHKWNGLEKVTQFFVFHEIGHSLEKTNTQQYGSHYNNEFQNLLSKLNTFNLDGENEEINKHITKNHKSVEPINKIVCGELDILKAEMYADVSAIINMRNYLIDKKTYDKNLFKDLVDDIIYARTDEYDKIKIKIDKKFEKESIDSTNIISNSTMSILLAINHLSISALEDLYKILDNDIYKDKTISEKEAHKICQKQISKGMSKVLYTLMSIDDKIENQLINIAAISFNTKNGNGKIELEELNNNERYKNLLTEIKTQLGNEWLEKFDNNVNLLDKKLSLDEKNDAILKVGLLSSKCCAVNLNQQMIEINKRKENTEDTGELIEIKKEVSNSYFNIDSLSSISEKMLNIRNKIFKINDNSNIFKI